MGEGHSAAAGQHVLIIGGGIGGLTAANALRLKGFRVSLFERAPELRPLGAAISVWTNAMLALDRIGLADAVRAEGEIMRTAELRTRGGTCLSRLDLAAFCRPLGQPSVCVHRGDLQRVLLAALPDGIMHLGRELAAVEEDAAGVVARFTDGSSARGDVLIGADGLNSRVREILHGAKPPRFAGYGGWLGVADAFAHPAHPPGLVYESWGRGRRAGAVHCGRGRVYWFVVAGGREAIRGARPGRRADVLAAAGDFHPPVRDMIGATDEAGIVELSFYDREPLSAWGRGRVTLLGDAAHPMTPNIGQGACTAIEDAIELAECLGAADEPAGGLRRYESRRMPRTAKLVHVARRLGGLAQATNPLVCALRNTAFWATPGFLVRRQLAAQLGVRGPGHVTCDAD